MTAGSQGTDKETRTDAYEHRPKQTNTSLQSTTIHTRTHTHTHRQQLTLAACWGAKAATEVARRARTAAVFMVNVYDGLFCGLLVRKKRRTADAALVEPADSFSCLIAAAIQQQHQRQYTTRITCTWIRSTSTRLPAYPVNLLTSCDPLNQRFSLSIFSLVRPSVLVGLAILHFLPMSRVMRKQHRCKRTVMSQP